MKLATAAYPLTPVTTWAEYAGKIEDWVREAAQNGAELLLFPEYAAIELAMLDGPDAAADLERSLHAASAHMPDADDLHAELATRYNVHISAGSGPVFDEALSPRPVNRQRLFTPGGSRAFQDKQIMTRYEREPMQMAACAPLKLFETSLGKLAILICYDSEFPLLGRGLSEAEVLLVPSCTEALSGYWRVRIGAMARALEGQCVSVMSSLVGEASWTDVADVTTGMGGVFGPPDVGFPDTGVIAEGSLGQPGWTYAEVDPAAIAHVRADGRVLNRTHWQEQHGRDSDITVERLS